MSDNDDQKEAAATLPTPASPPPAASNPRELPPCKGLPGPPRSGRPAKNGKPAVKGSTIIETAIYHLMEIHKGQVKKARAGRRTKGAITLKALKKAMGSGSALGASYISLPHHVLASIRQSLCDEYCVPCHLVSKYWFEDDPADRIRNEHSILRCIPKGKRPTAGIRILGPDQTDDPFFLASQAPSFDGQQTRDVRKGQRLQRMVDNGSISPKTAAHLKGGYRIERLLLDIGISVVGDVGNPGDPGDS